MTKTKTKNVIIPIILTLAILFTFLLNILPDTDAQAQTIPDVEQILNGMTLHEKVCQMMVVYQYKLPTFDANGNIKANSYVTKTETGAPLQTALEKYPVGGILYDAGSMTSHSQLTNLVSTADSYSKIPLLFTIDEEGGTVARIGNKLGYTRGNKLSAMGSYESLGTQGAYDNAKYLAENIADHGFNLDFAPVADTNAASGSVIGTRAYATDYDKAAELIPSAVQGFHDGGVACTLKHFPGHGSTSGDTHAGSVYLYKTLDEIRNSDLKPFQAGIDAGADTVMIAHIIVGELGVPCLFSHEIITDILREEMNFDGVVISDGLTMQAMTDTYDSKEIAKRAIDAGCDVLLCIEDLPLAVDYIEDCVQNGVITEERINESVRRILTLKYNRNIL